MNLRSCSQSNASFQYRSVYQAVNTVASWLVARTPPISNARNLAKATWRAAAGRVNLDATTASWLRVKMLTLIRAHFLLAAHITKVTPANVRSSANTFAASIVLRITNAIQNVPNRADSSAAIRNVKRNAGSLVRHVWSHASGAVPTIHARWYAVR